MLFSPPPPLLPFTYRWEDCSGVGTLFGPGKTMSRTCCWSSEGSPIYRRAAKGTTGLSLWSGTCCGWRSSGQGTLRNWLAVLLGKRRLMVGLTGLKIRCTKVSFLCILLLLKFHLQLVVNLSTKQIFPWNRKLKEAGRCMESRTTGQNLPSI